MKSISSFTLIQFKEVRSISSTLTNCFALSEESTTRRKTLPSLNLVVTITGTKEQLEAKESQSNLEGPTWKVDFQPTNPVVKTLPQLLFLLVGPFFIGKEARTTQATTT